MEFWLVNLEGTLPHWGGLKFECVPESILKDFSCFEFVYINFQDYRYHFQDNSMKQINHTYLQQMKKIDNISKAFVPATFLMINFIYWLYYLKYAE